MTETAKERMYREALEILRGMGINSNNRVMMPYGVAVTAQEFIEEKLEDAENMPSTTDEKTVEKLQEQLNTAKKALTEICEFDCSDDCYFTARDALAAIGDEGSGDE